MQTVVLVFIEFLCSKYNVDDCYLCLSSAGRGQLLLSEGEVGL